jgi:hypothetical protein
MENLRKKELNRNKKHSRLEQMEDRISDSKIKYKLKKKTEEILFKQLKSCERNMQEFTNSI